MSGAGVGTTAAANPAAGPAPTNPAPAVGPVGTGPKPPPVAPAQTNKPININTINVKISTNIPDQPEISLTKQLLVVKTPNYKKYNEYPFITGSIRIRKGILPLSYAERMDFFFIKERFKFLTKRISSEGGIDTNYVDEAPKPNQTADEKKEEMEKFKKNIKHNIYLLLNCVFITYPRMNNIISSKERSPLDIETPILIDRYSYVSVGPQKYTVARVVLINDIYNHYAFEQLRVNNEEFEIWKINESRNLDKKIEDMVEEQAKLFDSTYKDIDYEDDINKCVQSLSDATNVAGGYVTNRKENDIYIRALEDLLKALILFNNRKNPNGASFQYGEKYRDDILKILNDMQVRMSIDLQKLEDYTDFIVKIQPVGSKKYIWGSTYSENLKKRYKNAISSIIILVGKTKTYSIIDDDDLKTKCDDINEVIQYYMTNAPKMITMFFTQNEKNQEKITQEDITKATNALQSLADESATYTDIKKKYTNLPVTDFKQLYNFQKHFMEKPPHINVPQIRGYMKVLGRLGDINTNINNIEITINPDDPVKTRKYTDFIVRTNDALSSAGQIGINNQTKLLVKSLNINATTLQKYMNEKKYIDLEPAPTSTNPAPTKDNTLRMGIDEYNNEKYKKLSGEINKNIKLIQKMINYNVDVKLLKTDKTKYDKLIAQLDDMNGGSDECGIIFDNDKSPSYEVYIYLDLIKGQVTDTNNNLNMCGFKDGILKTKFLQEFYGRAKKIEHDPLITMIEPRYQKPTISSKNKTRKAIPRQQPNNITRRQLPRQIPQRQQ